MDIVLRTPHGDADISIVDRDATTTLGDIISAITGQAVPRLALVDGRAVDCSTLLDDAGLMIGSIVTTEPSVPEPTTVAGIELVQIAGHGAGRVVRLGVGQYRIGPGHRATADELELSPVDRSEFDLKVEETDGSLAATIVPGRTEAALDGLALDSSTRWPSSSTLTVGPRAFRVDTPSPAGGRHVMPRPASDGTVAFSRPPRRRPAPPRVPAVDAARDATVRSPTLWERRTDHPDAFSLPFGVRFGVRSGAPDTSIVTLDLADDHAVSIAGSERFRSALARTLLIEAATLHGPADLDVVVLTSPPDLAAWDWAKWLPHLRFDGRPAIWSSEHDIARWAREANRREPGARNPSHRTLVIVDDSSLWTRRDAPLRTILSSPPDDLLLLALCDDVGRAPAICSCAVVETPTSLARTQSFTGDDNVDDIWVALIETAVAEDVARSLAPLIDVDLPAPDTNAPESRVALDDIIAVSDTHDVIDRWAAPDRRSSLVIGRRDQAPVEIEAEVDVAAVIGSSLGDASDVATSWVLAQCADRSPGALWVVPLGAFDTAQSELLWRLPHAAQRHDAATPIIADQLVLRLRAVLEDAAGPSRILLITRDSRGAPARLDHDLLHALTDAAHAVEGLALLIISDGGDIDVADVDVVIRVDHQYRLGGGSRRATIDVGSGLPGAPFTPIEPSVFAGHALDLRSAVVGRPFRPLERRIEQQRERAASAVDPALADMVMLLVAADAERSQDPQRPNRVVVPPPLPTHIDLDELLATWPGDGVPLGLADDAATGQLPVWWQPGSGATLLFGSRRSGVEQVLSTIILGVTDRFASDDIRLVIVEPSSTRRRALGDLDHPVLVVAADRVEELAAALDEIEGALGTPTSAGPPTPTDGPRYVVVIADLAQLRRRLADTELLARLDAVLHAACIHEPGLDVVAYASGLASAGPFAETAPRRLVGACSDPHELSALGIDKPAELEGVVGRCRSHPDGNLVQLAMPAAAMEEQLARRSIGGAP